MRKLKNVKHVVLGGYTEKRRVIRTLDGNPFPENLFTGSRAGTAFDSLNTVSEGAAAI
jgi:hypothetical protein